MKFRILALLLFLNVFCKLASAQWNDEVFLLQDPEHNQSHNKIKKKQSNLIPVNEKKKDLPMQEEAGRTEEVRKPSQESSNIEPSAKEKVQHQLNYVDVMLGFRKMDQVSQFSYKDFYGETPTVGVKAGVHSGLWSWYLFYDTGFYYQVAKFNELRLRDEALQVGFLRGHFFGEENLYIGLAYFENQIVNENQNTDFIGSKKNGLLVNLEKGIVLDESMTITTGLSLAPWINYTEIVTQKGLRSGSSPSGMAESLRIVVSEKLNESTLLLFQGNLSWTQVQFKETTSVIDPERETYLKNVKIRDESYSFQIGFRWLN